MTARLLPHIMNDNQGKLSEVQNLNLGPPVYKTDTMPTKMREGASDLNP